MTNSLYYGDNLDVMRLHLPDESVDLVYLDPPFNSGRDYNAIFKAKKGSAQIKAFTDTWNWDEAAALAHDEILKAGGSLAHAMEAFHALLGTCPTLAYLSMMAPRLQEIQRVLKPTGSVYLHCDPTASHYLKILMDAIFGQGNFRNEIVWKRQSAHNDATTGFGAVTDTVLYYTKGEGYTFNVVRMPLDPEYVEKFYSRVDENGRRYGLDNTSAPAGGGMSKIDPNTGKPRGWYVWKGYQPPDRGWRYSPDTMQRLHDEGRLHYPKKKTQRIRLKRFLDENKGQPASCLWTDIKPLQGVRSAEGLGYPTQKPLALIDRIILASSNPGDVVLDPFCGCGTAVDAAQGLSRKWIGIDITHLAIGVMRTRLDDKYGDDCEFEVLGEPVNLAGARQLAKEDTHQFEHWALGLVGARASAKKKGGDKGIDGVLFMDPEVGSKVPRQVPISVKSGNVNVGMVRDLRGVMTRDASPLGVLVTLKPPTKGMKAEALAAGFYDAPGIGVFEDPVPCLQILSVDDLLSGKAGVQIPKTSANLTHKRATRA